MKTNRTITCTTTAFVAALAAIFAASTVSAQNVGIGTTTPKSKLSVNGSTASGGIAVGDATYTSTTGTVAPLNGAIIQGFTGIGTAAPLFRLHLAGDGTTPWQSALVIDAQSSTPTGASAPHVILRANDNSGLTVNQVFGRYLVHSAPFTGTSVPTVGWDAVHRGFAGGSAMTAMRFLTAPGGTGAGAVERMRIDEDGNVGIGDTDPTEARLVVRGNTAGSVGSNRQFTSANATLVADAGISMGFSIYASNAIVAEGNVIAGGAIVAASTVTPSDIRLKDVAGLSDASADLSTLQKIQVTNYRMKDTSVLGRGEIKKVIAQQVEEVYPRAVTRTSGYLPDIYVSGMAAAKGDGVFEIHMDAPCKLEAGTRVKLISAAGEAEFATVETAGGNSFSSRLQTVRDGEKVFVYGRRATDLRTVDYDALSMLNISATQELARKAAAYEAENARQALEITSLKAEVANLKAANDKLAEMAGDMDDLKRAVAAMQTGDRGTARTDSSRAAVLAK